MLTGRPYLAIFAAIALLPLRAPAVPQPTATPTPAPAPTPILLGEVAMTVGYEGGVERHRVTHDKIMETVGLRINEAVAVTFEVAPERAGEVIGVTPLDGGRVTMHANGVVKRDGKVSFTFQAGKVPGSYRLVVGGMDQYLVEFWAFDPTQHGPPRGAQNR